jgi:hypothetical protein
MANLEKVIELAVENLIQHVYSLEDITNDRQRNKTLQSIARVCTRFDLDIREYLPEDLANEYQNGYRQGGEFLIEAGLSPSNQLGQNVHSEAVRNIAEDTVMDMQAAIRFAEQNAIAYVERALQQAQNLIAEGIIMGANRKKITRAVMGEFSANGLTSFITSDGKRLPLDFYAKTVVRTKLKVAHTTGAVNRYKENGVKYGQTNEHHPTCGNCASRQGVIFRYTEEGDSSVPLASEVGLPPYHPNCRHTVRPIVSLEGRTIKPFNPDRDPRTPFQKRAYNKEQDIRRKANAEKKAYNRMRQLMPDQAPATLGAYRRMKRRNDEKWQALQEEFASISRNIKSSGDIVFDVIRARPDALTQRRTDPPMKETLLSRDYLKVDYQKGKTKNGYVEYKLSAFGVKGKTEVAEHNMKYVDKVLNAKSKDEFQHALYDLERQMPAYRSTEMKKVFDHTFKKYGVFDRLFKVPGYEVSIDKKTAPELGEKIGLPDITKNEKRGLRIYTGDDYEPINAHLRFGRTISSKLTTAIQDMESAFQKITMKENVLLQRGSNWMPDEIENAISSGNIDSVKGMVLQDKGYMSTSIDATSNFSGKYQLQIKAPQGTEGIYVGEFSEYKTEYEVILNKGTKLKIVDVVKEGSWSEKYRVLLEVVK